MNTRIVDHFRKLIASPATTSLVTTTSKATHVLVINEAPPHVLYARDKHIIESKSVLTCMEPYVTTTSQKFTPARRHVRSRALPNLIEWHLSPSHPEFCANTPDLTKAMGSIVSVCLSPKYTDPGHVFRINTVKLLDDMVTVHVYGGLATAGHDGWVPNHPQPEDAVPPHTKDAALFPYRYTFHSENFVQPGYVTEKFYDAVLAETFIFYRGDTGTLDAMGIPADAYADVTGMSPAAAAAYMAQCVAADIYAARRPAILRAKEIVLDHAGIDKFVDFFFTTVE